MKKTDLAYVAGIIDGEGWICIKNSKTSASVKVGLGNTKMHKYNKRGIE